jgi:bacillithiol system protein YtxJ
VRTQLEEEAESISNVGSIYFLDLLAHRDISDSISEQYNVEHQSPQLLLIKDGACTYNEALHGISAKATAEAVGQ